METCPRRACGPETLELLGIASMAEKGAWPASGGLLDQTSVFVDFARFAWSECERFMAEQRLAPPEK